MNKSKTIKGFIKNYELIREDDYAEDLLDFSDEINTFKKKLNSIKNPSIIGLIGPFGIGKSTMLHQISKNSEDLWIEFDAWKYPDRKNLWEGFILDFADQIGSMQKIKKSIDGKSNTFSFLEAIVDQLPGLSLGKFVKLFGPSPVKRIFEFQLLLTKLIRDINENIYFIIEDIDRSEDAGIFFLETLKQFIKNLKTENKVIVIVPIGDNNYYEKIDNYLKCLDYIEFFQPKFKGLEKFVDEVFYPKLLIKETKGQVLSFLEYLFEDEENMTMRLLKIILRKADLAFKKQLEDDHEPDWRVTLCIESSKFFCNNKDEKPVTYFKFFKKHELIPINDSNSNTIIFSSFLYAIVVNAENILDSERKLIKSANYFKIVKRKNREEYPSLPYECGSILPSKGKSFCICDFYFDY